MNIFSAKSLTAIALALGYATSSAAPADSLVVDTAYNFNAIDYLLQRPASMPKFENKEFFDHFFISAEAGATWMRANPDGYGGISNGYRFGVQFGDWITPVHGWRVGLNAGRHKGLYGNKPVFAGVSADYLMNLSALMRGDDYTRKFDVIASAGLEAQMLHRLGRKFFAGGARLGMQFRWYATPSTFLFAEPRFGIYSDNLDDGKTWHHYDWQASISFGLGYRLTRSGFWRRSVDNSEFVSDRFSDNLFAGVGVGAATFTNQPADVLKNTSVYYSGFVGKWFAAHSGVRIKASIGQIKERRLPSRWSGIVDLDYMANLNSIINGYDPDRKIATNFFVGVSAIAAENTSKHFYPGLHAGGQAVWNVSRNVGLYIEPELRMFKSSLMNANISRRFIMMPSVSLGLIYRSRPTRSRNFDDFMRQERQAFAAARTHYISAGGGVFGRSSAWKPAFMATVSFGGWFTPQTGWRFNLGADNYEDGSNTYRSVYTGADLVLSLSTLASGYDPSRVFDLRAFGGITIARARYQYRGLHQEYVFGPEAGLHAAFKVSSNFELFLEPMVQALKIPDYRRRFNPQWRLSAGITYRMGRDSNPSSSSDESEKKNFVSAGVGTGIYSETMYNHRLPLAINVGAGRWLNDISGVQLSGSYLGTKMHKRYGLYVYSATLDYLLNISALLNDGKRSNHINIIGIVGAGAGWTNVEDSSVSFAGKIGLQARWSVSDRIDLTLTPSVTGCTKGMLGSLNVHSKSAAATLTAGVVYNF